MPGAWPSTPPSSPDTSDDEDVNRGSLNAPPFKARRPNRRQARNKNQSLFDEIFASTLTYSPETLPAVLPGHTMVHNVTVTAGVDSKSYGEESVSRNNSDSYLRDTSHGQPLPSSHLQEEGNRWRGRRQLLSPPLEGEERRTETIGRYEANGHVIGKYSPRQLPSPSPDDEEPTSQQYKRIQENDRQPHILTPRRSVISETSSVCSIDLSSDPDLLNDPRYRISEIGKEKRWKGPSPAQNPIRDLPLAWEVKVKAASRFGHAEFSRETMARILPPGNGLMTDGWLNDDAVNEYLNLVAKSYNESTGYDRTRPPACHNFGSFFMQSLKTRGPSKMASWARRAKLEGQRLLEADLIFFPICEHNHWTIMVLFPKKRRVEYYNSFGGGAATYTLRLQSFLEAQLGRSFSAEEWYFEQYTTPCPQQDNAIDCGVFATLAAKYLSLGLDLTYSAADIPQQRKIMVGELMKGAFFGAPPLQEGF